MFSLKFLIFLIGLQNICLSAYGQSKDKFFRKDYVYLAEVEAFYKFHTLPKKWDEAKEKCETEGSELFYPVDDTEAHAVNTYWNETQPFKSAFIGISTPNAKQVFETIDGLSIDNVYNRWAPGEPNDHWGVESCVAMNDDGTLNDVSCNTQFAFICKKSLDAVEWNEKCGVADMGYQYSEKLNKCYKFHLTPATWTNAYTRCVTELSHLAVINSQEEADFLVELTDKAAKDDVEGDYLRGAVHLGFQRKDRNWVTIIKNKPVSESGYTKWGAGQPDGKGQEKCGSMFYSGNLNDIECNEKLFFICEHRVPKKTA